MGKKIKLLILRHPIWLIIVICLFLFSFLSSHFFNFNNLMNILLGASLYGTMAIGMTFLMINGKIDLSIGSVMALAAAVVISLQTYGIWLAIILALVSGVLVGAINGVLVSKFDINSFVVTLAAMIGVRGFVYVITHEKSIMGKDMKFAEFGSDKVLGGIPTIAIIFIFLSLFAQFILRHTIHGRNAYAVGGNIDAAQNAGIRVKKHVLLNFILSGITAAIAGVLLAANMNAATPTLGLNYELMVITAVVLGGIKLTGGFGSMTHAIGGVLVIAILQNGMNLIGVQSYYNTLIMGLVLLLVTYINRRVNSVLI